MALTNKHIAVLCIFFVVIRLLFLFFSPYTYYEEESKEGVLGHEILEGQLTLPFWCYLDSPHAGGSIFTALTSVPFYFLFGDNYLALKINALVFSFISFILILQLLKKRQNKGLFLPLVLLFCISTPNYLQKSLFHIGNTAELVLFIVLVIFFFHRIFIEGNRKISNFALMGFFSGLGLWIAYGQITVIITAILFWYIFDHLFFIRKEFFIFLFSFIIGFLPWIVYNLIYNFASLRVDDIFPSGISFLELEDFIERYVHFLAIDFPKSFQFLNFYFLRSQVIAYFFYAIIIFLLSYLIWKNKNYIKNFFIGLIPLKKFRLKKINLELFLLVYLGITTFFFCFFNIAVGGVISRWNSMDPVANYYIFFLQPFIFILVSIALVEIRNIGVKIAKWFYRFFVIILTIILMIGFVQIIDYDNFNEFLFSSMRGVTNNAVESGHWYAVNLPLFTRVLNQIENSKLKKEYLKGAGIRWNYLIIYDKFGRRKGVFKKQLKLIDKDRKKTFLYYVLHGEKYKEDKTHYINIYEDLTDLVNLSKENKQILREHLKNILASTKD